MADLFVFPMPLKKKSLNILFFFQSKQLPKIILISLPLIVIAFNSVLPQEIIGGDTIPATKKDTLKDEIKIKMHSPKKATLYSMILPGLGQAYNKKYLKIPAIYAVGGVLYYFIQFNNKKYNTFKEAYNIRTDNDTNTIDDYTYYSVDNLLTLRNYYRRNLELTYILSVVVYLLNIIDASVDAHLFYYDVSEDLSMGIEPALLPINRNQYYSGIKLTFRLK
ncbi:DUF5683 domain-containing protein [Bacteroidota bacterium]